MIRTLLVAVLTLCSSQVAHADSESDCPSVRLDSANGNFSKIPVYDQAKYSQTDSSICYAVATSALVDDYRMRQGEKLDKLSSPLSIAIHYKLSEQKLPPNERLKESDSDSIAGGEMRKALAANQGQIICDQNFLEKFSSVIGSQKPKVRPGQQTSPLNKNPGNFINGIIDQIHSYEKVQAALNKTQKEWQKSKQGDISPTNDFFQCRIIEEATSADEILAATKSGIRPKSQMDAAQKFMASLCKKNSLKIKTPQMEEFTGYPSDKTTAYYKLAEDMQTYAQNREKKRELQKSYEANFGDEPRTQRMQNKVNEILSGKKTPLGVAYCGEILQGANDCVRHASVIIGQRFNKETSSCEVLVRNSYGPTCVDSRKQPRYVYECEKGNIWIRTAALMKKTTVLNWIP